VTSERRKKPFQLARGAIHKTPFQGGTDSRRTGATGSDIPLTRFWNLGWVPAEIVTLTVRRT
jgi:hypothetical protein